MYVVIAEGETFAVYPSGTVRHLGSGEADWLLSQLVGAPGQVEETDQKGIVNLYRDSGTYVRPDWWEPQFDEAPYSSRDNGVDAPL